MKKWYNKNKNTNVFSKSSINFQKQRKSKLIYKSSNKPKITDNRMKNKRNSVKNSKARRNLFNIINDKNIR